MHEFPRPTVSAPGDRSVAAETLSGQVATGDHARFVTLAPGTILAPDQVTPAGRVEYLPRFPARVFTGRKVALAELRHGLAGDGSAVVTQAIYGLGGIGKSELALHYACARRADYRLVWWITADSPAQIEVGLAALAARLCPAVALAGTTRGGGLGRRAGCNAMTGGC